MEELASDRPLAPVNELLTFDAFVLGRTDPLLRTAYLLTGDHARAEDLLQTALARAYRSWPRIGTDPEPHVRAMLFSSYTAWWHRADTVTEAGPDDVWAALGRLSRRQRAVIVLRFHDGFGEAETARVLGWSLAAVRTTAGRALAVLDIPGTRGDAR